MRVFKFGGASVKDAQAVQNVAQIVENYQEEKLLIVISAMGKMTNHLEKLVDATDSNEIKDLIQEFHVFHKRIAAELSCAEQFTPLLLKLTESLALKTEMKHEMSHKYDEIVSHGELASTLLVESFLRKKGNNSEWIDARNYIKTDSAHKNTSVLWEECAKSVSLLNEKFTSSKILITQGFIASNKAGETTTLGREGSDFSAAIFAFLLSAEDVTIWKDVPGMLNADPKWFKNTVKLKQLSYREAIELAYYGASVIHPKTVQPLENKKIPLFVKSFLDFKAPGTVIKEGVYLDPEVSSFIFKTNQALISFIPHDFSFVGEEHLKEIFSALSKLKTRVNLMQNSAISFSIVVDNKGNTINEINSQLFSLFKIKFNADLELLTIRHYDEPTIQELTQHKTILLEQRSRRTIRLVLSEKK